MKTTRMLVAVSIVPLMVGLAGCKHSGSSSGGSGGGDLVPGGLLALTADDTASNALVAGETLKADPKSNSATIALNYSNSTAKSADAAGFSIKKKGDGVEMVVNGETISFAAANLTDEDGWEKQNPDGSGYKGLWTYSADTANDAIDGTDQNYLQIWEYASDGTGNTSTRGIAVVGAETPEDVVKGQANATYAGWAGVETSQTDARRERTRVQGELTLSADFAGGAVSGSVDSLEVDQRTTADTSWPHVWQDVGGKVVLGKADISSNGFSGGAVSLDGTAATELGANISGSTYSGRFYGPDAEQVGGVMNIKGKNDEGKSFVGFGYFAGDKQP